MTKREWVEKHYPHCVGDPNKDGARFLGGVNGCPSEFADLPDNSENCLLSCEECWNEEMAEDITSEANRMREIISVYAQSVKCRDCTFSSVCVKEDGLPKKYADCVGFLTKYVKEGLLE